MDGAKRRRIMGGTPMPRQSQQLGDAPESFLLSYTCSGITYGGR
jgi:hypothetical protein